ncbi:MAG: hypothetical protein Q9186_005666 [Xanthomendoza sp. 1 TL-2023]
MGFFNSVARLLFLACLANHSNAVPTAPPDQGNPPSRRISEVLQPENLHTGAYNDKLSIDVEAHYGTYVNPFPLLLNAVDALATIGIQDLNGRSPSYSFQLTKYPTVVIDVKPGASAADFQNWAASLCIYHGIEDVVRQQVSKEVDINCRWNTIEMVTVSIRTVSPGSKKAASVSASNITESTLAVSHTLQPYFYYVADSVPLDYTTTMITLMYSIMYLSRLDKTDMIPRTYTDAGPHWDSSIVFPGDGPQPPKDPPPFLESGWVIETLKMVPNFMIQQRRFAELGIQFHVDNVYLGGALLQKGKPSRAIPSERYSAAAFI